MHISRLSYSVTSVLRLGIHRGVPVAIVEYYRVRACQIDADAARSRWQDKAEYPFVAVEPLHQNLRVKLWSSINEIRRLS